MNTVTEKLKLYYGSLAPHIKERVAAKLILESIQELERLEKAYRNAQDKLDLIYRKP